MTTPEDAPAWDLDALREQWQAHDVKLDALLRLDRQRVREQIAGRFRTRLRLLSWRLGAGLAALVPVVLWLGDFGAAHRTDPRFLAPTVLLLGSAIGLIIASVRQLVLLHTLTPDMPVAALQAQLEALRVERLRTTIATLAAGPLLWLPALLVVVKSGFAVDLYAVANGAWIVANLALGVVVLMVVATLVRRHRVRPPPAGTARHALLALLAGDTIADARRFLAELAALDATSPEMR